MSNFQTRSKARVFRSATFLAFTVIAVAALGDIAKGQSTPSGPAGGDLAGTYPNPILAVDRVRKTGDSMTGALDISLPNQGGLRYPFSLSSSGNAGPGRGVAFEFNLPAGAGTAALGAEIVAARESWGYHSYLSFSTHNGTAVNEVARIIGNGNFGLGTTTPTSKLHLRSGTDSATTLFHLDTGTHGGTAFAVSGTANNESGYDVSVFRAGQYFSRFGVSTAGNVYLQPGGGTVGIGTGTPNTSYRLDVQGGTINASGGLCIAGDCKTAWSQVGGGGSSQWTTSGTTINYAGGNVGIATTSPTEKLDVTGNVKVTGNINVTGNISAKYQDVAEWVDSSQELAPGTVVVLDTTKSNQVIAATRAYDSRVAGVISRQPGLVLGEAGEGRVLVATTGRVKVKVDATHGPIEIGDLLVTSDREGVAMKSVPVEIGGVRIHRPGTLIGKALEPLAHGTAEILVLLSMQ